MRGGYPPCCTTGPHHIRFVNCEFRNTTGEIVVGHTWNDEFIGGSVHDNGDNTGFRHGLNIGDVADILVDGMKIYNNMGYGVHIYHSGTGPDGSVRVTVRNNVVYNNGTATGQCGILYAGASDSLVYNNVVYNNGSGSNGCGIAIGRAGLANNIGVYNNTVTGNAGSPGGIYIQSGSGNIIRDNIIWNNQPADYYDFGTSATADHNLIGINPRFVNEAGHDYHLQAGSPAIDAGVAIIDVTTDIVGTRRPQGCCYDLGAYEYQSLQFPAPKNFSIIHGTN